MILFISPKFGAKPDSEALIAAAKKAGIKTHVFLNNWNGHSAVATASESGMLYGEHAFCDFAAQELRWNLYQNSLDWMAKLPHSFVKRSIQYMTLDEVIDKENHDQSILDKKILESADDPCFPMGVYTLQFPKVPRKTPILVHSYHEWSAKYRFIVANQKVVASCCYRLDKIFNDPVIWGTRYSYHDTTPEAFMSTLLNHVNCAPGCVIDIGLIKDVGWAVAGTRPIWCADLYGCSPAGFLKALEAACQPFN